MEALMSAVGDRVDGWQNVILGLGGEKDHTTYTRFAARGEISDHVLEALYREDHFAAKIVEALPKHALRPGWDLMVPGDPDKASKLRDAYAAEERRLEAATHLSRGACWGRLFGGALTWIGADDARPTHRPLDETSLAKVEFLHTFDRRDVQVHSRYADPTHPRFQQPEAFVIRPRPVLPGTGGGGFVDRGLTTPRGIVVHETRCLVWPGQPTTDERRRERNDWDDSVLERVYEALRQVAEDYGAKTMIVGKVSQAVYKLKDLWGLLTGNREEVLAKRMALLERSRSRGRAIVLDTSEGFENIAQPLGGVADLIDRTILRLASAADMPVSILMGQSPAGFGDASAHDLDVWSAEIDAWRELVLRPRHERLARLVLLAKAGPRRGTLPREGFTLVYRGIQVPRPREVAEVEKLRAEADALNIDRGVYPADAAAMRYAPGAAQGIVLSEKILAAKRARSLELADQPPKDNAELGTVGPRTAAILEIVQLVHAGKLPRESGIAMLREVHRQTKEAAEAILGPEDFEPKRPPAPPTLPPRPVEGRAPGPDPEPAQGAGAGAPQGMPGFNAGGAEGRNR